MKTLTSFHLQCWSHKKTVTIFLQKNSAKSRVRGTLDIYHAFIRDLDDDSENVTPPESPTPPETATPPEWDIINSPTSVNGILLRRFSVLKTSLNNFI